MAFVYAPRHVTSEASVGEGGKCNIIRSQLPLLPAYAFINYKIQGHSLDQVIIDLHLCCTLQSAYVMLSRARSLEGILIMQFFKPDVIYRTLSEQFRTEFRWLQELEALTKVQFDAHDYISVGGRVTHSDQVHSLEVKIWIGPCLPYTTTPFFIMASENHPSSSRPLAVLLHLSEIVHSRKPDGTMWIRGNLGHLGYTRKHKWHGLMKTVLQSFSVPHPSNVHPPCYWL